MFELTIDAGDAVITTRHPDRATAHHGLVRHAVGGDLYLHPVHATAARTTYHLLRLTADRWRPHRAGRAVVQDLAPAPTGAR